jgi:hypothetical protein
VEAAALMTVVALEVKVILFALAVLDLYVHRVEPVELEEVPPLLELQQEHQQVLVPREVVLEEVAEKVQGVIHVMVIAVAEALVDINLVVVPLVAVKALLHSPLEQMALMAVVAAVVDLVTIAKLVAAVLAFYWGKAVMVRVVLVVLHGVKAVLAVAPLALLITELMAVYMAAAALVQFLTRVIITEEQGDEVQSVLFGVSVAYEEPQRSLQLM